MDPSSSLEDVAVPSQKTGLESHNQQIKDRTLVQHHSDSDLASRFERLREKVLVKRPVLRSIIDKKGNKTLLDYTKEYVDVNLNPTIPHRQHELLWVMRETVTERFGKDVAESVIKQLEQYYFVSTADHTGPVTHPFFMNSNLLIAASLMEHSDPLLQNVIVLSCANISANNSSLPRGLLYHTAQKGAPMRRACFFPSSVRPTCLYELQSYQPSDIEKLEHALEGERSKGEILDAEYEKIRALLNEIYKTPEIFAAKSYAEQVGKTNFKLWQKYFEASNVKLPNLVYLEIEDIVVKLITNFHLYHDTIINHVLFDPKYEPFINDYFEGIFGSFTRAESVGTYLFWAAPPPGGKFNQQLWRKGNHLVSADESVKIELHPEAIREAMASKQLIPSLLLDYMVISFYYGLKCLGGFNQVNYLTLMKNAYIKMNVDLGNYRSIEICARAQTKEICDGLTVAFLGHEKEMVLATGLDLMLHGNSQSWQTVVDMCKALTVEEALNPLMPEIYKISYEQSELEPDLVSVTEKDINELTGLNNRMKACVRIDA